MANEEHLALLKQGVVVWNQWRREHSSIQPTLSGANLSGGNFREVDLREADLGSADLTSATLSHTDHYSCTYAETDDASISVPSDVKARRR